MSIEVKVLKLDWETAIDPVPIIGGINCLDFLDRGYRPRSSLTKMREIDMRDCATNKTYRIVLCASIR
jgi:hypothetical protein